MKKTKEEWREFYKAVEKQWLDNGWFVKFGEFHFDRVIREVGCPLSAIPKSRLRFHPVGKN